MFNRTLKSFVPHVYEGITEMENILEAEEQITSIARREMISAFSNTFVLTADELGVIMFERMLNIISNPLTEDLEFRRQRILNRLAMSPPFTFRFLKKKLDDVIGVGAWNSYIDFDNYTLYVESSASNQGWFSEIAFTINQIKPCNMIFINVPHNMAFVNISEEVSYGTFKWWYRLGSWRLGQHPFASQDGGGMLKMADIKSIQHDLLNDTANFLKSDISYVLINNSIRIDNVSVSNVENNVVSFQYAVTADMTNVVTNIKLMSQDGRVLTDTSVYVPVTETIMGKHTITVKEGA